MAHRAVIKGPNWQWLRELAPASQRFGIRGPVMRSMGEMSGVRGSGLANMAAGVSDHVWKVEEIVDLISHKIDGVKVLSG